ncbi:MAG: hypothetical protein M5U15_13000 [Kiritimatiellae bacterium]|nr:hypothetical protein [Kiritimatiellia bacterium]
MLLFGLLGLALAATSARAESVVDKLIASYDAVQSVQVEIRRDTAGGGGSMRRLSRVYFKRPDPTACRSSDATAPTHCRRRHKFLQLH